VIANDDLLMVQALFVWLQADPRRDCRIYATGNGSGWWTVELSEDQSDGDMERIIDAENSGTLVNAIEGALYGMTVQTEEEADDSCDG
jgi:hypothetical protein